MSEQPLTLQDLTSDMPAQPASASRIESVGIIGGGVMGRGIAQTLSTHGLNVLIVEKDSERLQACLDGLSENMDREIQRWAMTTGEKRAILSRIKVTTDINEMAHVDFAMEAVDEGFELKRDVLLKLDPVAAPGSINA